MTVENKNPEENQENDSTMETMAVTSPTGSDTTMETIVLESTTQNQGAIKAASKKHSDDDPKYEVLRKLGKGGFAWVYLVNNIDLNRKEAIKILNAEVSQDESIIDSILKEARVSAKFNHQNIVTIYEVRKKGYWHMFKGVDDEIRARHREPFAFFTMSFIEGRSAADVVREKGRYTQKDAVRIAIDACNALEYAHRKGIYHRDIKPDNILVDNQGRGIIMDFGIAKDVDQTKKTAAGTFMGTARYVSPEQAKGTEVDGRTDLYSLGVALYELVTGHVPFSSTNWMTVLYSHINEPPPPPEKFCEDIDRDLRGIILKMLEKDMNDRFQTAGHAAEALNRVYQRMGGEDRATMSMDAINTRRDYNLPEQTQVTEISQSPPSRREKIEEPTPEPPPPEKSKAPIFAGIAVLVAIIAAVGWWATRTRPGPEPLPPDPIVEKQNEPVVNAATGRLLISSFPKGQLVQITDTQGNNHEIENAALPAFLTLPEGNYTLTIAYEGRTETEQAFVSPNIALSKVNVTFEVEDDLFLLEDLK